MIDVFLYVRCIAGRGWFCLTVRRGRSADRNWISRVSEIDLHAFRRRKSPSNETRRILRDRCDSARCNSLLINSREIPSPILAKVKSREAASCIRPIYGINPPLAIRLRIRLPRCVCGCSICSWTALFCRSREDVYRGGFRHPPLTAPSFLNRYIHRYTHSCTLTMSCPRAWTKNTSVQGVGKSPNLILYQPGSYMRAMNSDNELSGKLAVEFSRMESLT